MLHVFVALESNKVIIINIVMNMRAFECGLVSYGSDYSGSAACAVMKTNLFQDMAMLATNTYSLVMDENPSA